MHLLVRWIFRVPGYIRSFGFWSGLRLLLSVERTQPRYSDRYRHFRLPGYRDPIYLRDSTADHATFRQCLVMQQYDLQRFPQYERLLRDYREKLSRNETPLIIDAGANIGLATRWFAKLFPEARIVAVEPDPQNFGMLLLNIKGLEKQAIAIQGGVWDRAAHLVITNPEDGSAAFQLAETGASAGNGIRAYSIDEICEMHKTAAPFIVKFDIEGAQAAVFRSNTGWIEKTHLITLELDDWLLPWKGTSREFFACLSQYPFDYLLRDESIFCFRDFDAQISGP